MKTTAQKLAKDLAATSLTKATAEAIAKHADEQHEMEAFDVPRPHFLDQVRREHAVQALVINIVIADNSGQKIKG